MARAGEQMSKSNPRRSNSARRNKVVKWLRSQARPCWICRLPIDYSLPAKDPCSFECDELIPVSKGGSPFDRDNVGAAHRCCNNWRNNKSIAEVSRLASLVLSKYSITDPLDFVTKVKSFERHTPPRKAHITPRTTTKW